MMSIDCARARSWMDRRAAGLNDADRLRLEDHLVGCAECSQQSHALHAIQNAMSEGATTPSEAAQRRVIARAIAEARTSAPAASEQHTALRWPVLAAACTLLVAFAAWRLRPIDSSQATVVTAAQTKAPVEKLLVADAAGRADVEGAELSLTTGTRALWNAGSATLRIEAGQVSAHVQPRHAQIPFRVVAKDFVVVVVGTRFVVAQNRVDVTEGSVRVERREHAPMLLRAGEHWQREDIATTAHADVITDAAAEVTDVSPLDLLAQARTRLARGDVSSARNTIERARRLPMARPSRAEAETLLAECDQVEGKLGAAIDRYRKVAAGYRDLGAGDNAAYAAARLALTQHDARARGFLQDYLQQYPNGRFRHDAQAAFDRLSKSHDDAR